MGKIEETITGVVDFWGQAMIDQELQEIYNRPLRWVDYQWYIQTRYWKAKAEIIRSRDSHQCTRCTHRDNLQVHHKTYERLGCELAADLETLCHDCHESEHYKQHAERMEGYSPQDIAASWFQKKTGIFTLVFGSRRSEEILGRHHHGE